MEITKYTLELTSNEMFDLAYALEHRIEADLSLTTPIKDDSIFNDFECEVKLLQGFVDNGYQLTVSAKSGEGHSIWSKKEKNYDWTEEWFKDLLKQRRKEFVAKTKVNDKK